MSLFVPEPRQSDLLRLLTDPSKRRIFAYGGSRSGKTRQFLETICYRAITFPGSRHLVVRLHSSHARTSIFLDTLQQVLKGIPRSLWHANQQDQYIRFGNGSEIWVGGLDDGERVDKILGHEYCTIYFNEISQISWVTVQKALTRLAQNVQGCINRAYFDCNPPSPRHWAYSAFIKGLDPKTGEPIECPEMYAHILMNPGDCGDRTREYIASVLNFLPDRERRRFRDGEWVKPEGAIYDAFDLETCQTAIEDCPKFEYFVVGSDITGNNLAAVLLAFAGGTCYLCDEISMFRASMSTFNAEIVYKWGQYGYIGYADPAGGALIDQLSNTFPGLNAVEPGINSIRELMEQGRFKIVTIDGRPKVQNTIEEIDSYHQDELGRIVKENDHHVDALRYGVFTHKSYGGSLSA